MIFQITPELFAQIVETTYAKRKEIVDAEGEIELQNWAHLTDEGRAQFAAQVWLKLDEFRRGDFGTDLFTDALTSALYDTVQAVMGRDWTFMLQQGITLADGAPEVMAQVAAIQEERRAEAATRAEELMREAEEAKAQAAAEREEGAPVTTMEAFAINGDEQLQAGLSTREAESGRTDGSVEGSNRPGGGDEDHPADTGQDGARTGKLERRGRRARSDEAATVADGSRSDPAGQTTARVE